MKKTIMHSKITTWWIMAFIQFTVHMSVTFTLFYLLISICKFLVGNINCWDISFAIISFCCPIGGIIAIFVEESLDRRFDLTTDLGWGEEDYKSPYEILNKK